MIITLLALAATAPDVVARREGSDFARFATLGELIQLGPGQTPPAAIEQIIWEAGVAHWPRMRSNGPSPELGVDSVWSDDGRSIRFYYRRDDANPELLCRMSRNGGPIGDAPYEIIRWCAGMLGVSLPAAAPPIVSTCSLSAAVCP